MKFKRFITLIILIISIITISGCSNKKPVKVKTTVSKLSGNVQIWGSSEKQEEINAFITEFNKSYPNVKVSYITANDDALLKEAVSESSNTDLMLINDCYIKNVSNQNQGYYRDISKDFSDFKDNFSKSKLANVSYSDKILAFPYSSMPVVVIYRSDCLSSAGIDPDDIETWFDFEAAGKKMYSTSGQKTRILAVPLNENNNLMDIMLSQLNISYFDESGNIDLKGEQTNKAISTLNYLNVNNSVYAVDSNKDALEALNNGSAAAIYGTPETIMNLQKNYPGLKNKLKIMKLPSFEPGGNHDVVFSGYSVMIKDPLSQNQAAFEFAKFISTDEKAQAAVSKTKGYFPANSSCYSNSVYNEINTFYSSEKVWKLLLNVNNSVPSIAYNQNYQEAQKKTMGILVQIVVKKQDVKTIMDNLGT